MRTAVRRPVVIVSVVAGVAALVWWQFPLLTDQDSRTDVVVMSDQFLRGQQKPVHDRIQEEGLAMVWDTVASDWCDVATRLPTVIDVFHPTTVVLSYGSYDGCDPSVLDDVAAAAGGTRLVVVRQPGTGAAADDVPGATVVDPTRFVGSSPEATTMPCQWWEGCPANGSVPVRAEDGSLTAEGTDRVARMIAAEL